MGIMGQVPPDSMLPRLEKVAMQWALADRDRKVMPALHLIATVAQGKPGSGSKYRLRMGDSLISLVASWAEERGWIVFLDIQTGHSTVAAELEPLVPFLERPYVHLALDPEFAMKSGGVPGRRIGTLDASDVNHAVEVLSQIVAEKKLPPKVLVVHRFTRKMLTNTDSIRRDPRVQVVIQMDGFGSPAHKQDAYRLWISPQPVQYAGFKLFYKNDRDRADQGGGLHAELRSGDVRAGGLRGRRADDAGAGDREPVSGAALHPVSVRRGKAVGRSGGRLKGATGCW